MVVSLADGLDSRAALLAPLAAGGLHSAASLARLLGAPRTEIEATVEQLRALGIEITGDSARGYRLGAALELLDGARIRAALDEESLRRLASLDILFEIDSTNTLLLARSAPPAGSANVALAELQSAGRGRRGRRWMSPFGASLAMSVAWRLPDTARADPTLSLAVGVAVVRALARLGAGDVRLKWPNDVWFNDRKIAGVLAELKTEAGGSGHLVIGVGLNVSLSADARDELAARGAQAAALSDACTGPVSRNALAATLLEELLSMLGTFERRGFAPFRDEWLSLDALGGRWVRVLLGERIIEGISRGVDTDGALLVETGGRLQRFVSGEASLRLGLGET
jgi:BirA family transcriptional regulator, biotin operon repressor / biotin---[acetyl-CoA-carboxylase] ligase